MPFQLNISIVLGTLVFSTLLLLNYSTAQISIPKVTGVICSPPDTPTPFSQWINVRTNEIYVTCFFENYIVKYKYDNAVQAYTSDKLNVPAQDSSNVCNRPLQIWGDSASGTLFASCFTSNYIVMYTPTNIINDIYYTVTVLKSEAPTPLCGAPSYFWMDTKQSIFVACSDVYLIKYTVSSFSPSSTVASTQIKPDVTCSGSDIIGKVIYGDIATNDIFIVCSNDNTIHKLAYSSVFNTYTHTAILSSSACQSIAHVLITSNHTLIVACESSNKIIQYAPSVSNKEAYTSSIVSFPTSVTCSPSFLWLDSQSNVYVSCRRQNTIVKIGNTSRKESFLINNNSTFTSIVFPSSACSSPINGVFNNTNQDTMLIFCKTTMMKMNMLSFSPTTSVPTTMIPSSSTSLGTTLVPTASVKPTNTVTASSNRLVYSFLCSFLLCLLSCILIN